MKLHEEFKEYETMWDDDFTEFEIEEADAETEKQINWDEVLTSYPHKVNGKIYDLANAKELRAAMEAAKDAVRAMKLKGIILDGEAGLFSDETKAMARQVWKEYKAGHNLH